MKYTINFSSINKLKQKQIFALNLFYIAGIFFMVVMIILGLKKIGDISSEAERVRNEKKSLEEMIYKSIEERRRFISDEEVKMINEKVAFYKEIYEKRFFITPFLTDLEDSLAGGMTLKSLDIDVLRKNFIIIGEGLNPESAVLFSKKLTDIGYIKKAEIGRQNFQRFGEKKILINDFEIRGEIY